jgi:molybdopterin molybdotransferase
MTSPAEAEAAIRLHVAALPAEPTPLLQLAGAVLREPIVASRDQPPFDRVMMDGIAIAVSAYAGGRREFRIAGTQAAGARQMLLANADACFEVMTGAVTPHGCDAVIPVEQIVVDAGVARLADHIVPVAGMNIHARGLDCRAGSALLEAGTRLGPAEVAVIASTGLARVAVSRSPRIVVISTGDELVEPGDAVESWQIYRSNAYGVLAVLQRRGFSQLAHDHLPDDLDVLRTRLRAHLENHDVLILSGGVSMGKFDYIPQVLGELGIRQVFHKVEQRPGRPLWFGVGAHGRTVYALPGNPVSTLVCLLRYVLPGLDASLGATLRSPDLVALSQDFEVRPALTYFLPVKLEMQASGAPAAVPRPTKGSGDFTSLIGTDGFVELPPGPQVIPCGTVVPLYRW